MWTQAEDCSNPAYRKNHKEECCPCFDTSDSVCYSPIEIYMAKKGENIFRTDSRCSGKTGPTCEECIIGEKQLCVNDNLTDLETECHDNMSFSTQDGNTADQCYVVVRRNLCSVGSIEVTPYSCGLGTSYVPNGWSGNGTCTN